jgi:hypothetical protein
MGRTRHLAALAFVLTAGVFLPNPGMGQELPWLTGGRVRFDFAPTFWAWDSRYGSVTGPGGVESEEVEDLSIDLAASPFGSAALPHLRTLEYNLREALQDNAYQVRLGSTQAFIEQSRLVFPFRLDVGVTDWLAVGAMVPLVRPRTEMVFTLDADSLSADVGLTPGADGFLSSFGAFLDNAESQSPGNPALLEARSYLDALSGAYGHGSFFPVTGSLAGSRLQERLDNLRASLTAAGFTGLPETVPLAESYLTEEDFSSFLTSPAMQGAPLGNWTTPLALGDVEITAAVRLIRVGFQPDSMGTLPFFRAQLGVGALVRLATGTQEDPYRFLDLDPSDDQMDFEGSLFGMVDLGTRFGAWANARFGLQQEGTAIRRIASPSEVLPDRGRMALLNWTPGNYFDLQVNPRYYFTPDISFGMRYRFWFKGSDRYALPPVDPETAALLNYPAPEHLNYETRQVLHEVGISATYSTLAPHARGETPIPLQARFTYYHPVAGAGGQTPKGPRLEAGLSVFRFLWGREEKGEGPVADPTNR